MSEELHIAGIIVHARPQGVQRIARALGAMPGVVVHETSRDGKLVVTLEGPSARAIAAGIDAIRQLDAVLSTSLVYQHSESLAAMMEEVPCEDDTTGIH